MTHDKATGYVILFLCVISFCIGYICHEPSEITLKEAYDYIINHPYDYVDYVTNVEFTNKAREIYNQKNPDKLPLEPLNEYSLRIDYQLKDYYENRGYSIEYKNNL